MNKAAFSSGFVENVVCQHAPFSPTYCGIWKPQPCTLVQLHAHMRVVNWAEFSSYPLGRSMLGYLCARRGAFALRHYLGSGRCLFAYTQNNIAWLANYPKNVILLQLIYILMYQYTINWGKAPSCYRSLSRHIFASLAKTVFEWHLHGDLNILILLQLLVSVLFDTGNRQDFALIKGGRVITLLTTPAFMRQTAITFLLFFSTCSPVYLA